MPEFIRRGLVYALIVCLLGITGSNLMAQDTSIEPQPTIEISPSETPTDIPTATATEITSEVPTDVPTETATEVIPATATDSPTEVPTTETTPVLSETATLVATVEATATDPVTLAPEPALSLLTRELFEVEPLAGWTLPAGWARTAVSDGFALKVEAAAAGSESAATFDGVYYNAAVMGYFTFGDETSAGQLIVRESAAGSYRAQLDTTGVVTLEKRDGAGTVVATWNTALPTQAAPGSAHALRLSAMGSVLRVTVDSTDVLSVEDATPLPPGGIKVGAHFAAPTEGSLLFDNFFLWIPNGDMTVYAPTTVPATGIPTEVVVLPPTPTAGGATGKSTIPQSPGLNAGPNATGNDDFANRNTVALLYSDSGSTIDNSVEAGEPTPSCGFNISRTAWYEFTPPAGAPTSEAFVISSAGSSFDTMIAVYTGAWGSLTEVACSDDTGGMSQAQLTTTFSDSQTYYIQLGGYNGSSGNFTLRVMRPADMLVPGMPVISSTAVGAPSTPIVNSGKTNNLQPVLAWNSSGSVTPYSYEIQVSTSNGFGILAASGIINEPTRYITLALPVPALPAGQVYYWRVRARNFMQQTSAWSTVYNFTLDTSAPTSPSLISPAVNSVSSTLRPMFKWQALPDASSYQLQVTTNFSCATLVSGAFDVTVTTASYTFPADLPQGEYWFCVKAKDAAGNEGVYAEKRHFAVNISLTPAQDGIVVIPAGTTTTDLKFTWSAVTGASYIIEVADDSSFTSTITSENVAGTSFTLPNRSFGTYYWRMSVNGNQLPASLARHFTVTPPLPTAPLIPTTGALAGAVKNMGVTNDTTPVFDWTVPANWLSLPIGQSITYELQLATDINFTALVGGTPITGISSSDFEWTVTTLPNTPGTVYYWRVRAVTNLLLNGSWSAPFRFTLDTTAPNPPVSLTTPVEGFVSSSARPAFKWTAPTGGATSYRFEISTDSSDFDPPAIPNAIVTLPSYTATATLPQGTYYWRVWAIDAAGNESLTPTGYRTLNVDYRSAPAADFAAVTTTSNKVVTFSWVLASGAPSGTTYTIELDNNLDNTADDSLTPTTTGSASTPGLGLAQGDYQYRLVVSNGLGTSGWRPFFVSPALPSQPRGPFTPLNNAVTANSTPLLTWTAPATNANAVTGYWVEISTNASFTAPVAGSPFNSLSASPTFTTPALSDNKYFWRVQAYNSVGAKSVYSFPWYFFVDTTPPNPPAALVAPNDDFVSTNGRPAFSWTAPVGGAAGYRFEISVDSSDFDPPALPDALVTLPSYSATTTLPQEIYHWQVWARDAAGNESLTPTGNNSFTVDYRTAPAKNAILLTTGNKVTFSWVLAAGAPVGTTYTIEIDNNFDFNVDTTLQAVTTGTTSVNGLGEGDYQYRLTASNNFGTSGWRTFFVSPPAPGTPTAPFAPANNSATTNTTPTLSWAAPTINSGSVSGYWVEIATDKNFANLISGVHFDAGNNLSYIPSPLGDGTYYWRVQARTSVNLLSGYTAVMSFTVDTAAPPSAPTLTAPLNNALTNLPRPTFTWSPAPQASGYVIEIDDENSFANPLFYTTTVSTTTYALPTSTYLRQGTYYWRVWTMDAAGNLNPGPIGYRMLNVNYAKTPADDAIITSVGDTNVTFTWSAVPITPVTANSLRVQIATNNTFSPVLASSSPLLASNVVSYTTTTKLTPGHYYWRLLVNGHPSWPTALVNSFTISPAAPAKPTLSAPAAVTNDTTPVFMWNAVSSPSGASVSGYELELSTTNTFAALVGGVTVSISGGTTTSYEWAPALPEATGQVYYARIRAVNSLGVYSLWSTVRSFTLDTVAPGVPVLNAPGNNVTVTTGTPTFSWTAVTGAARYEIRYGTSPDLTGASVFNVTTTLYKAGTALPPNNYYWEVRALDAAGNAINWNDTGTWEGVTNRRAVKVVS